MTNLADLQHPGGGRPVLPTLPMDVSAMRTFDTPEFAGMTFLEVETKSALNRVKGMPFEWSINPYRGCSHACSYCAEGGTPVLMADGRTRPIAEVRPGDRIIGTAVVGRYRRYRITTVLDHWSTMKAAFRVALDDGSELLVSGDHRFLTDRGWKHVIGGMCGAGQRPYLTTNNRLLGLGATAPTAPATEQYRRGYLCGMIRGDADLGRYVCRRSRVGGTSEAYRFRLALADLEPLHRSSSFLNSFDVQTTSFVFQEARATRREMRAIRAGSSESWRAITELIRWPTHPHDDWTRGFLAGIFDAEGGYNGGIWRVSNTNQEILGRTTEALRRLKFPATLEPPQRNGCRAIRITGGLPQHLRFFLLTDPATTRKRTFEGAAVKHSPTRRVMAVEPLDVEMPLYDMTTGTGDYIANGTISHNCFARPSHTYLNLNPRDDFEKKVVVKTNVVEVLKRELTKPSWKGEHVAMGTNTDPYQRCEGRYRLMPGIIAALAEAITPFSILTKGTLITRDLDVLARASDAVPVTAAMTIGMLDEQLWRDSEPGTPSPVARLDAVRALNDAGIATGVMLAPVMPELNDDREQLAALVDRAARAGATHITPIVLHLRPGVREIFWPWLEQIHPELIDTYHRLYRRSEASDSYRRAVTAFVAEQREAAWRRHGRPPGRPSAAQRSSAAAARGTPLYGGEQLRLL